MLFAKNEIRPELTDPLFQRLARLVRDTSGLVIEGEGKREILSERLAPRVRENRMTSFEQYVELLDGNDDSELPYVFDAAAVLETSFFRNPSQWDAFRECLLPEILEYHREHDDNVLHFWSAGCSTGEEAYTIAIVLCEALGASLSDWDVKVVGTDISALALDHARKGVFRTHTLRNVPDMLRDRYFEPVGRDLFAVSGKVRERVSFHRINLRNSAELNAMSRLDVIFCRNVITYLDVKSSRELVRNLYRCLRFGGHLVLGRSEMLHTINEEFRLVHLDETIAYQK